MNAVNADQLADCLRETMCERLNYSLSVITNCTKQLSRQQFWWQPGADQNSIANICLHLCGNLQQWVLAGVGGAEFARNRPLEFSDRSKTPLEDVVGQLTQIVAQAVAVISECSAEQLVVRQKIQGFDVTVVQAINEAVSHFVGHTQQIVQLTRFQLGDEYAFYWEPSTPEELSAES